ncbi:MAG: YbaB/EbfC family nucleoid-associated protein [Pseudomonadota bacterium]
MDIMNLMKKAQEMQAKVGEMQTELEGITVEGSAGAGLVTVEATAKGAIKSLKIDPSLLKPEEAEIVEDLVMAAFNDARTKAEAVAQEKMQGITGGLSLPPGFKMPF